MNQPHRPGPRNSPSALCMLSNAARAGRGWAAGLAMLFIPSGQLSGSRDLPIWLALVDMASSILGIAR